LIKIPSSTMEPTASASRAWHYRVDVGVIPHVKRCGSAGTGRDAEDGDESIGRMNGRGCAQKTHQGGEYDEQHHARLRQREIVASTK
jgi:hypothetical protein